MKLLKLSLPLLLAVMVPVFAASTPPDTAMAGPPRPAGLPRPEGAGQGEAGSYYCSRCHAGIFEKWQNRAKRQPCESCHGPGRHHALAPTRANIKKKRKPGFVHGPGAPAARPAGAPDRKIAADLFVMSLCPYGMDALNTLLPLAEKWKDRMTFRIYYIAHARGSVPEPESGPALDKGPKCESAADLIDGTDKWVSLHGLEEVLEDLRQVVVAEKYPARLYGYILARNRDIRGDWRKAARAAGLSARETEDVARLIDTDHADSLFAENIAQAEKRGVRGSPTLYIDGMEFSGNITAYALERNFCQREGRAGPCRGFPACGFDEDCVQKGMEGRCVDPMRKNAKCVFGRAPALKVTVINDEACPVCHTGNLVREIRRRFPGAAFEFLDLGSARGRALVEKFNLDIYPAFIFGPEALKNDKFKAIAHTFDKRGGSYVLRPSVINSYHFIRRPERPGRLDIFGQVQDPPFIEMIRDLEPVLTDTALRIDFRVHPAAPPAPENGEGDSAEVREGVRQLCVGRLYPGVKSVEYMLCRGFDVQKRFEKHAPEPPDEWRSCARRLKLNAKKIERCVSGAQGKKRFEESGALAKALYINDPGPAFLINNNFKVAGYHPAIRRVILETLRKAAGNGP